MAELRHLEVALEPSTPAHVVLSLSKHRPSCDFTVSLLRRIPHVLAFMGLPICMMQGFELRQARSFGGLGASLI